MKTENLQMCVNDVEFDIIAALGWNLYPNFTRLFIFCSIFDISMVLTGRSDGKRDKVGTSPWGEKNLKLFSSYQNDLPDTGNRI